MTKTATYSAADAIDMLRQGGVDLSAELSNITAAYADITDEIEAAGGSAEFTSAELAAAIRAEISRAE